MRISPALLLLILVLFVFSPSISEWITETKSQWYRPFIVWISVISFVYWIQREPKRHEH